MDGLKVERWVVGAGVGCEAAEGGRIVAFGSSTASPTMSQYAPPPVPDWALKSAALPDSGAPTPPAFQSPPAQPPASSPAWQGIRLPTTPSSYNPFPTHHHPHPHAYQPYQHKPHHPFRPTPRNPAPAVSMAEDEFRQRQRHILSPQPRYPPGSGHQHQPGRLELDLLRQQGLAPNSNGGPSPASSLPGFWSPQPSRPGPQPSFTSPPPHHATLHSPPTSAVPTSIGVTLPPRFLAKQSPSITPLAAGLHPNHQPSQLSSSLATPNGSHSSPGLLSINTSLATTAAALNGLKQEVHGHNSPTSTTTSVQDPHTSSSDDPHKNGNDAAGQSSRRPAEGKDDGCHSTAASPPHVSTTRISPGNQDNSSTSATDTPNSILEDDKGDANGQEDCNGRNAASNGHDDNSRAETGNTTDPMETGDQGEEEKSSAQSGAQGTPSVAGLKQEPCDSAHNTEQPEAERPQSSSERLVMDVDQPRPGVEAVTPSSLPPTTPTSQETASASALLSLSQSGDRLPQPSESNVNAALRLEERIAEEAMRRATSFMQTMAAASHGPQVPTTTLAASGPAATVTRPPGLGPVPVLSATGAPLPASFGPTAFGRPQGVSGFPGPGGLAPGSAPYQCPICGFSSTSKFHFNSHMNTHTDHQCTMCDYTARTEGRLKRHMEGHSEEDKQRAGVNRVGEPLPAAAAAPAPGVPASAKSLLGPRTSESSNESQGTPERERGGSVAGEDSNSGLGLGAEPSPLERLQMQLNDTTPNSITASIASTPPSMEGAPSAPRRSTSSSKPKSYKCKQCEHVSQSKEESWRHARVHIKPDKLLTCPQCEFVTEYKHHLEYHLRNHFGSKPFQCQKCHYSCVNKSMLNSHMKSHSQFYQFRCSDCTYATKYCHSLKLHLRKYGHRPATVVTPDGQHIDPSQSLDLYGNRARHRQRQRQEQHQLQQQQQQQHLASPFSSPPSNEHNSPVSPHALSLLSLSSLPSLPATLRAATVVWLGHVRSS